MEFDEHGFPRYARPRECDLKIVPHNRQILLDWDGHSNVEYTTTTYTMIYLYKYLFKGNKKSKVYFNNEDEKDEITAFLHGRITCAMSACWRFFGYQTYPPTQPSVKLLDVKHATQLDYLEQGNQMCELAVYFMRPPELHHLKYTEFYSIWTYSRTPPKRTRGEDHVVYTIQDRRGKDIYIFRLEDPTKRIVRMQTMPIGSGNDR